LEKDIRAFIYTGGSVPRSAFSEFYDKIEVSFPNLGFISSKDIQVDVSYYKGNLAKYRCEYGLSYLDNYIIQVHNMGTFTSPGNVPYYGVDGLLMMEFLADYGEGSMDLFMERPEDAKGLVDLFDFVCVEFDAIFAIAAPWNVYCRGHGQWRGADVVGFFKDFLYTYGSPWGTFYFREDMAHRIGLDVLRDWAISVERVDDAGYNVERFEVPFLGGMEEYPIWIEKMEKFFDSIAPHILSILEGSGRPLGTN
jgi:hypothetical protein